MSTGRHRRRSQRVRSGRNAYMPAFVEVGDRARWLLLEADDAAVSAEPQDSASRGVLGVECRQRRDSTAAPDGRRPGPQIELRKVVGIAGEEHLLAVDPVPVGGQRPGAAEQFRLEERADVGRRGPRGHMAAHDVGQVVEVDQDLVDARPVKAYRARCRAAAGRRSATCISGWWSVIGRRRLPSPAASRNAFTPRPSGRPRARASGRWPRPARPSRPSIPLSHAAYAATESAGVCRGSQPSAAQRADVREDVARVAEAVFAGYHARLVGAVLPHDDVGELAGGDRPSRRRR